MTTESLKEWAEQRFAPLSAIEARMVEQGPLGEWARADKRPGDRSARTVRADFLRTLLVERQADLDPRGVRLRGALIAGSLDLSFVRVDRPLALLECVFPDTLNVIQACIQGLWIRGSVLRRGFHGDGIVATRNLALDGTRIKGETRLVGACIHGNLSCDKIRLINKGEAALVADRIQVDGSVFLTGAKVIGETRFIAARLAKLDCQQSEFANAGGYVLNMDGVEIRGDAFLRKGVSFRGVLVLTGATIKGWLDIDLKPGTRINAVDVEDARFSTVRYSAASLAMIDVLSIDGCTYDRLIEAGGDENHGVLREMLKKQDFYPQPFTQLAKVLRSDGHEDTARRVLMERQDALRNSIKRWRLRRAWMSLLRVAIGYGYAPRRALGWLLTFWLAGAVLFGLANHVTQPDTALADRLLVPARMNAFRPAANIQHPPPVPVHYPRFQSMIYSLDTLIPFLDLDQEDYWLPNASAGRSWIALPLLGSITSGNIVRWYLWLHIAAGWLFGTLLAASVTGIIKKE